jgi:hypothetical protein
MEQSRRSRVRRVRIGTRLSTPLRDRLARYCAASGVSERSVMETALAQYLDASGDLAVLLRRFDRVDEALGEQHRDIELVAGAVGNFIRVWMEARASGSGKARSVADAQFRNFLEQLARGMAEGHRFRDDLPIEVGDLDQSEG